MAISVQDYPPGEYNLTIMATDIFGQSVDERVSLILAGMCVCMQVYYCYCIVLVAVDMSVKLNRISDSV